MSIVSWDPFRELDEISTRLSRALGRSLSARPSGSSPGDALTLVDWTPSVDIAETPEEFQVKCEIPDVKKEDVKVRVDNGTLRIEGERRREKEESGKRFHRVERSYGTFMRSFSLPDNVEGAKVSADFKDGVLLVHLPKSAKTSPKAIDVKVT